MARLDRPGGDVLIREGQQGFDVFILLEAEVEGRHGDRVIARSGPGEYLGEIALLDRRPRTTTVVATTPLSIEVLRRGDFACLLAEVPQLGRADGDVAQRPADRDTQAMR